MPLRLRTLQPRRARWRPGRRSLGDGALLRCRTGRRPTGSGWSRCAAPWARSSDQSPVRLLLQDRRCSRRCSPSRCWAPLPWPASGRTRAAAAVERDRGQPAGRRRLHPGGAGALVLSGAYDLRLPLSQLDHMPSMGVQCVDSCLQAQQDATLGLQLKALGAGSVILLVTNLVVVGLDGGDPGWPVSVGKERSARQSESRPDNAADPSLRPGRGSPRSSWSWWRIGRDRDCPRDARDRGPDRSGRRRPALLLLVMAQLACASSPRRGPGDRLDRRRVAGGRALPRSGSTRTPPEPAGVGAGAPGSIGLADGAVGVLEAATLAAAVLDSSGAGVVATSPWRCPTPASWASVGIVAVTAIGVGGSGPAAFDLGVEDRPRPRTTTWRCADAARAQPAAIAGMTEICVPSGVGVARLSRNRTSSSPT